MKKAVKIAAILFAIAMIVIGFYCLLTPGATYLTLAYAIGFSMLIDAIGRFGEWWNERKLPGAWLILLSAGVSLIFSLFLLGSAVSQLLLDVFIAYAAAAWIIAQGIIHFLLALKLRKIRKEHNTPILGKFWLVRLIISILLVIFGVFSMINPLILVFTIGIVIGCAIIAAGIHMLSTGIAIRTK